MYAQELSYLIYTVGKKLKHNFYIEVLKLKFRSYSIDNHQFIPIFFKQNPPKPIWNRPIVHKMVVLLELINIENIKLL